MGSQTFRGSAVCRSRGTSGAGHPCASRTQGEGGAGVPRSSRGGTQAAGRRQGAMASPQELGRAGHTVGNPQQPERDGPRPADQTTVGERLLSARLPGSWARYQLRPHSSRNQPVAPLTPASWSGATSLPNGTAWNN